MTAESAGVLLVDDELLFARAVARHLEKQGFACDICETLKAARQHLFKAAGPPPGLVLLDMRLPDGSGLELLKEIGARAGDAPAVIVMTAFGDIGNAVVAMKAGAVDYLRKPVDLNELAMVVGRTLTTVDLRHRLDYARERESHATEVPELLGNSAPLRQARDRIGTCAEIGGDAGGPPPTVLVLGETGTGKDIAAHRLHALGRCADRPFVRVDCATLRPHRIEDELFGHADRIGLIEAAEDGSLLLDEIGDLPLALQAKLLNLVERRSFRRVGATRETQVACRFIATTNRPLEALVKQGKFRADLYFRLNILKVTMPPLRDCTGDPALLAAHFVALAARRFGRPAPTLSDPVRSRLDGYHWPGNVRELRHAVERAVLIRAGGEILLDDLTFDASAETAAEGAAAASPPPGLGAYTMAELERMAIEQALRRTDGNVSKAARELGLSRMAMRYRIEKQGISLPKSRSENG